jgi:hypothetical protein
LAGELDESVLAGCTLSLVEDDVSAVEAGVGSLEVEIPSTSGDVGAALVAGVDVELTKTEGGAFSMYEPSC